MNANWYGLTPLFVSLTKGNLSATQFLLDNGANPQQTMQLSLFFLLKRLKMCHTIKSHVLSLETHLSCQSESFIFHQGSYRDSYQSSHQGSQLGTDRVMPICQNDFGTYLRQYGSTLPCISKQSINAKKELYPFELAGACGNSDIFRLLLSRYRSFERFLN